jgi:hypothetical protein
MDKPPKASAAAAVNVVKVFLVVIMSDSLDGIPEGNKRAPNGTAEKSRRAAG